MIWHRAAFLDRASVGALRLGLVRSEADFARLADEWPHYDVPYRSHEWLHTWWRHFGRQPARRELCILTARDRAGVLRGVLPLYREHAPVLRRAHLLASGAAGSRHLGLVAAPADEPRLAAALAEALVAALRERYFDVLDLDHTDADAPLVTALAERLLTPALAGRQCRPETSPPSFDRVARRASRVRGVEVECVSAPHDVAGAFGDFIRLVCPRWPLPLEAFFRDAARMVEHMHLYFLVVAGRRRAAMLALAGRDRLYVHAASPSPLLFGLLAGRGHALDAAGGDAALRVMPARGMGLFVHAAGRLYLRLVKGAA